MKILNLNIAIFCILLLSGGAVSQDLESVKDLEGQWKFKIGDNLEWAETNYDDSQWDDIYVPDPWEDQGYHGYDGFAWYRTGFTIPEDARDKGLYLELGYIDDADEVYVNGKLIGHSGSFYPQFITAYSARRQYYIPKNFLKQNGKNVIAVRVLDTQLSGGIVNGDIRLLKEKIPFDPVIPMAGSWRFRTGNNENWKNTTDFNSNWNELHVPGFWEDAGYRNYDGDAWYGSQVEINQELAQKRLLLVLGRIDDYDKTYFNGTLIGQTGFLDYRNFARNTGSEYSAYRAYYIPSGIIHPGSINTITVHVYDRGGGGGIYQGPVGIITEEDFVRYWREKARMKREE
ncbi:MAG: beta galactosidase jelly roll domain-containing protein [Bacteroidales bacterium]|nr:beta galactosidase jelly roll domain-containing protein [Bacteroidales bacterium]MCF8387905.1 beta galactosidase jelly roll domain-containing protein [Bacteroidales bacterium]MCF8398811.1 beta galactosidase jelly roll domain-containing protein [Bacteroidales bacterium]